MNLSPIVLGCGALALLAFACISVLYSTYLRDPKDVPALFAVIVASSATALCAGYMFGMSSLQDGIRHSATAEKEEACDMPYDGAIILEFHADRPGSMPIDPLLDSLPGLSGPDRPETDERPGPLPMPTLPEIGRPEPGRLGAISI